MSDRVQYFVSPEGPYSLERTLSRFTRYPESVDRFDSGIYRRLLFLRGRPLFLSVAQSAKSPSKLVIEITGKYADSEEAKHLASQVLERVLGAATDVRPFYRQFRSDPLLGPLIRSHAGLRVAGRLTVWETLLQIVLSQQIHLKLAHAMLADLARELGRSARLDGTTYYTFPSPAAIAAEPVPVLRRFRLSQAKAETLKRLAAGFESGELADEELRGLSDEEAFDRLTAHKGVGRWTAEFTLLRGLGRMDVFPAGDLGVVKYVARGLLGRHAPALESEMREFAERWRPYRGLALIYAYAELASRSAK